jgi:hypothetical protein
MGNAADWLLALDLLTVGYDHELVEWVVAANDKFSLEAAVYALGTTTKLPGSLRRLWLVKQITLGKGTHVITFEPAGEETPE